MTVRIDRSMRLSVFRCFPRDRPKFPYYKMLLRKLTVTCPRSPRLDRKGGALSRVYPDASVYGKRCGAVID